MALNKDHIAKWEYSLDLKKEPDFVDPFFTTAKHSLLNKILMTTRQTQETRRQLETIQEDPLGID